MPQPIDLEHPQLDLLFAIEGPVTDAAAKAMREAVIALAASRPWIVAPPIFLNAEEVPRHWKSKGQPFVSVGALMKIYSFYRPWDRRLPIEIDQAQYEEACAVVGAMAALTRSVDVTIIFELDGAIVGYVAEGAPEPGLAEMFLGEWALALRDRVGGRR